MVNFSLNAGSLMGIILAFAGAGLYFLRSFRPNLARDYDVFFAAIALICGGILFFQSWRLDPILQFGVFLLAGSTVFFAVDSIRLRDIATEQAKRNTPLVDDDRPVSRSYQYQSEDYGPGYGSFDAQRPSNARRIRGSRDFQEGGYEDGNGWGDSDRRDNRRQPRSLDWGRDRDPDRADAGRVRTRRAALERPDYGSDYGDAWDAPSPGPGNGPPYGGAGGGRAGAGCATAGRPEGLAAGSLTRKTPHGRAMRGVPGPVGRIRPWCGPAVRRGFPPARSRSALVAGRCQPCPIR